MKIGIQGIKGAFHQQAAQMYFNQEIEIVANATFRDVIESVIRENTDMGIIAIENTISGTIHNNLNLIRESDLNITGEVYLRIEQNLAVLPGTQLQDLKQVESHYMAINQCREFFRQYPKIQLIESPDTALSIKNVAKRKDQSIGAIGSDLAIKEYGLFNLSKGIETNKKNYTRFIIVSNGKSNYAHIDKASIVLVLPHEQGSLAKTLSMINEFDINLSKIESFPILGEPWHYQFYLDLNFSYSENYRKLLKELGKDRLEYQVLGEYKFGKESYTKINKKNHDTSHQNANS